MAGMPVSNVPEAMMLVASSISTTPSRFVSPTAANAIDRLLSSFTTYPTPRPVAAAADDETIPCVPFQFPPFRPVASHCRTVAKS